MMYDNVILNEYGFYTLKHPPSDEEREAYYRNKYYQNESIGFSHSYTNEECDFFKAKLEQKLLLIEKYLAFPQGSCSFCDIGCGEGFALAYFKEKGFAVLGLDYSDAGIKNHNADIIDDVIVGDVYSSIEKLLAEGKRFNVINMDNVLEHVVNPFYLLHQVCGLLAEDGVVIIKVPNDFSLLQKYFFENKIVKIPHWVAPPDHISYFNIDGLINICRASGFDNIDIITDSLIEFFALNPNTNYFAHPLVGKSCHFSRVAQENIFHRISPEQTIELYRVLAKMGLGREIIGVFRKMESKGEEE